MLVNPENIDELFKIYVNTYPGLNNLKAKFEYGLRYLLENGIVELREELLIQVRFGARQW